MKVIDSDEVLMFLQATIHQQNIVLCPRKKSCCNRVVNKVVTESTLVFVNLQYVSNDRMENIRPVLVQESDTPEETQANGTNISANQGNVEYFEPD